MTLTRSCAPVPDILAQAGVSALMLAAGKGHVHIVRALLSQDPAPNLDLKDHMGRTALYAKYYFFLSLFALKSAVLKPRHYVRPPMHSAPHLFRMHASWKGHADCVQELLLHDPAPDADAQDESAQSALFKAAAAGHGMCTLLLLTQTPKIFARDKVRVLSMSAVSIWLSCLFLVHAHQREFMLLLHADSANRSPRSSNRADKESFVGSWLHSNRFSVGAQHWKLCQASRG
jgi:ankyrin repeat protein